MLPQATGPQGRASGRERGQSPEPSDLSSVASAKEDCPAGRRCGALVRNCSTCPIHTPPGLTVASQRNCNPAATLTTILSTAQHRRGRRPGSLTRQIETTPVMRRAIAPSQMRRTPCKKTQSHGTACACHNAANTTVAAQAPISPTNRRLRWPIASTKIVQAHAATRDAIEKGKNEFTVECETAGLRLSFANDQRPGPRDATTATATFTPG